MKEINIGILGCGLAGSGHLASFLKAGGKNAWVWDVDPNRSAALAKEYGAVAVTTFEELLARPEINAICIATPNGFHAVQAIQSLRAGKHVLLEKPIALNAEDAEAVIAVAEERNLILHIGFELRHSTFPIFVKKLISSGEIGQLYSAHLLHYRGHFWPQWKGKLENGGDMYLMEDCHAIDLFRWWSGDEVETVHAVGVRRNVVRHYEFPDTQFSTFVFRNGFVAHISDCHARSAMPDKIEFSSEDYTDPAFGHQYEYSIVGENGSLHFLPLQGICRVYRHELQNDGAVFQRLSRTVNFSDLSEAIHNCSKQMALFMEMLRGERPPIMQPRDALQSHLVCFAARQAQTSGYPVKMTPAISNKTP